MKVCKYCGTTNEIATLKCLACGASDFSYKCGSCGTIFGSGYCPTCGTKAGAEAIKCPDCGARYFSAACPNCGYSAARRAARREFNPAQNTTGNYAIPARTLRPSLGEEPVQPRKRVTFGKVLLWIFFFPIMLVIAIWKSGMHWFWKIVLTLLILMFLGSYSTRSSTSSYDNSSTTRPVITARPAYTDIID